MIFMSTQENGEGIPLECPRDSCGKKWNYGGKSFYRTICPDCGTTVRVKIKCPKCEMNMVGNKKDNQWECIKGCGHVIKVEE